MASIFSTLSFPQTQTINQSSEIPKGELSLAFMKGSLVLRVVDLRMELEALESPFQEFSKKKKKERN